MFQLILQYSSKLLLTYCLFMEGPNPDRHTDPMSFSTAGGKEPITRTASNCHPVRIPSMTALRFLHHIACLHETCEKLLIFQAFTSSHLIFFSYMHSKSCRINSAVKSSMQFKQLKEAHP